jgi:outer membrane protein assembly factor BamD (BamD/ComL family)
LIIAYQAGIFFLTKERFGDHGMMKFLCKFLLILLVFSGCSGNKTLRPEEIYQKESAATLKSVADEMYAKGFYEEAEKTYHGILEFKKDDPIVPEVVFNLADTYHQEKKFSEEVDLYTLITEKYPTQKRATDIFFRLGKIFHHRSKLVSGVIDTSDFKKAVDFYNRVVARADSVEDAPILMESYYSLGEMYLSLNQNSRSKVNFEKLIHTYPSSEWAEKARKQISLVSTEPVNPPPPAVPDAVVPAGSETSPPIQPTSVSTDTSKVNPPK